MPRRALVLVTAAVTALALAAPMAAAQDPTSASTTVGPAPQDIVPEPNSGTAPSEAGDRGGALQLGLLALVALVISGAVAGLVRQSRQARRAERRPEPPARRRPQPASRRASQAGVPSRKPER